MKTQRLRSLGIETQQSVAPERSKQELKRVLAAKARTQQDPEDARAGGEESQGECSSACKHTDFRVVIKPRKQGVGVSYLA